MSVNSSGKKRIAGIFILIWLIIMGGGYAALHNMTKRLEDNFYERGVSACLEFADKNMRPLVGRITGISKPLTVKTDGFGDDLKFVAILDDKNIILKHTDPGQKEKSFVSPLKKNEHICTIRGVVIEKESSPRGEKLVGFSSDITTQGTEIGSVYLAVYASALYASTDTYRLIFFSVAGFGTLILLAVLLTAAMAGRPGLHELADGQKTVTIVGNVIGDKYKLESELKPGGMAELYLAVNKNLGRTVAVKVLLPHLAKDPDYVEMFRREARLAASLADHPNIVQTIDFVEEQNAIVMEYVRGKNLAEIAAEIKKDIPLDRTVFIISEICKGLEYSHFRKIPVIHRDIKPSNIIISFRGEVKISDFGIAKAISSDGTIVKGVKGTLDYIAPEQALGEPVNQRADIYSVGIMFYEMLSGEKFRKFSEVGTATALMSISNNEITSISNLKPQIPHQLNNIVMKCLEKDQKFRYRNIGDLLKDLKSFKERSNINYDASELAGFMEEHFDERKQGVRCKERLHNN